MSPNDLIIYNGRTHTRLYAETHMRIHGVPFAMAQDYLENATMVPFHNPYHDEKGRFATADSVAGGQHQVFRPMKEAGGCLVCSEKIAAPKSGHIYAPDPRADRDGDGVTEQAHVGVPAFSVPPPPKSIPRLPNLTAAERQAEENFAHEYQKDPDGVTNKYIQQLKEGKIGDAPNIFGTDDAKLLSGDYNPQGVSPDDNKDAKSRLNAAVHQTANAIAKRGFLKYLDDVVSKLPPENRTVLVTAGGVAAGKDYAISQIEQANTLAKSVGAIWNAAGEQNSTENPWVLKECEKRGIKATFMFVHADPTQTWESPDRGVIERAQKKGRMVDAKVFADSYDIGVKNFEAFAAKNRDKAEFIYVENIDKPKLLSGMPPEALKFNSEEIYARSSKYLDSAQGTLKPSVLRGGSIGRRIWGPPKEPKPVEKPAVKADKPAKPKLEKPAKAEKPVKPAKQGGKSAKTEKSAKPAKQGGKPGKPKGAKSSGKKAA